MNKIVITSIIALAISVSGLFMPLHIHAQEMYTPLEPTLSGAEPFKTDVNANFPQFMKQAYRGLFRFAAFLAIVMIIYGGVLYVFAGFGGSAEKNVSTAKDIFTHLAIGGTIILLAWLTLNTINPKLVDFSFVDIPNAWDESTGGGSPFGGGGGSGGKGANRSW